MRVSANVSSRRWGPRGAAIWIRHGELEVTVAVTEVRCRYRPRTSVTATVTSSSPCRIQIAAPRGPHRRELTFAETLMASAPFPPEETFLLTRVPDLDHS